MEVAQSYGFGVHEEAAQREMKLLYPSIKYQARSVFTYMITHVVLKYKYLL